MELPHVKSIGQLAKCGSIEIYRETAVDLKNWHSWSTRPTGKPALDDCSRLRGHLCRIGSIVSYLFVLEVHLHKTDEDLLME